MSDIEFSDVDSESEQPINPSQSISQAMHGTSTSDAESSFVERSSSSINANTNIPLLFFDIHFRKLKVFNPVRCKVCDEKIKPHKSSNSNLT